MIFFVIFHYAMNQLYLFGRLNCLDWSVIKYINSGVRAMQRFLFFYYLSFYFFSCVNHLVQYHIGYIANIFLHFLYANI